MHPVTAKAYDIPETYVAELNLSAIEGALQPAVPFVEITKFPAVSRDVALLLKAEVTHQEVVDAIQAAGVKRLTDIKRRTLHGKNPSVSRRKSQCRSALNDSRIQIPPLVYEH
ncbi:phenylalanyl-tRNA synthetase%2C beta chain [Streptococcus pneumoniae]|nr:phenylalanyl-tRNA synthetase%2C beta chain [Streptococcus pneumoniae]